MTEQNGPGGFLDALASLMGGTKKTVFFSEKIQKGGGLSQSKRVFIRKNEIF